MHIIQRGPTLRYVKPSVRSIRRRITPCRASLSEVLISQSAIIGKGLTLFVLFTASLNYLYYRRIRIEAENLNKPKGSKEDKDREKTKPNNQTPSKDHPDV